MSLKIFWNNNSTVNSKRTFSFLKFLNTSFFSLSYKIFLCQMELSNFLWSMWDIYVPSAPTKNYWNPRPTYLDNFISHRLILYDWEKSCMMHCTFLKKMYFCIKCSEFWKHQGLWKENCLLSNFILLKKSIFDWRLGMSFIYFCLADSLFTIKS